MWSDEFRIAVRHPITQHFLPVDQHVRDALVGKPAADFVDRLERLVGGILIRDVRRAPRLEDRDIEDRVVDERKAGIEDLRFSDAQHLERIAVLLLVDCRDARSGRCFGLASHRVHLAQPLVEAAVPRRDESQIEQHAQTDNRCRRIPPGPLRRPAQADPRQYGNNRNQRHPEPINAVRQHPPRQKQEPDVDRQPVNEPPLAENQKRQRSEPEQQRAQPVALHRDVEQFHQQVARIVVIGAVRGFPVGFQSRCPVGSVKHAVEQRINRVSGF